MENTELTKKIGEANDALRQLELLNSSHSTMWSLVAIAALAIFVLVAMIAFPEKGAKAASYISLGLVVVICVCSSLSKQKEARIAKDKKQIIAEDIQAIEQLYYQCQEQHEKEAPRGITEHQPSSGNNGVGSLMERFYPIVETLQRLEMYSRGSENEFNKVVRNEVEEAVKACGLEFVGYADEYKSCYRVERANVNEIKYGSRAIVSPTDKQLLIKGKVFLPKN